MRNLLCGVVVLLAGSCIAKADNFYNSEAAWLAALSGSPTTVDFAGIAPASPGYIDYGSGPGSNTTVGGVNFAVGPTADVGAPLFILAPNTIYNGYNFALLSAQTGAGALDLLITLPSSSAFGFDFIAGTNTATITLSDGASQTISPTGNPEFFGVTGSGGITTVEITQASNPDYAVSLEDFSYGTASGTAATPEPASLLLFGTVLAGTVGIVRRRRRAS